MGILVTSVLASSLGAEEACRHGSWRCRGDNTCILREKVCDSRPDCPDQSDEDRVCRLDSSGQCPDFMFTCPVSGQCVSQVLVCNGVSDCIDGNDESQCGVVAESEEDSLQARSSAVAWNKPMYLPRLFLVFSLLGRFGRS